MRYLFVLALLLPLALSATTMPCSDFSVGPVSFTNCQIVQTEGVTAGGGPPPPPIDFHFVPGSFGPPGYPPNEAFVNFGFPCDNPPFCVSYYDSFTPHQDTYAFETLSADFTVDPGFLVTGAELIGKAISDGTVSSVNVVLNGPCHTFIAEQGIFHCGIPGGVQTGTLSLRLSAYDDCANAAFFATGV